MTVPTQHPAATPPGWSALFRGGRAPVTTTLAAGVVLHSVNVFLATTILPSVIDDIGGEDVYAWATTVFMFASVIGSTTAAALLAARGPRASYRLAALVLGVGTLVCALAPTMPVLLVGRAAQGLGGGVLFALSYSMVRSTFEEALWPRALALVSAMWGVSTLVGPALGGAFAQLDAWRGAFWVLVPLIGFFAVWGAGRLPASTGEQTRPEVPWVSVGLLGAAVLVISAASISAALWVNLAGLAAAVVLLAAWLRQERHATRRLLPATVFGADGRLRLVYLTMTLLVVTSTVEIFVPYFGQTLQGLEPLAAGYLAAMMSAGWTAGSLAFSGALRRRGAVIAIAPGVTVVGMLVLVATVPNRTTDALTIGVVAFGLFLLGWGIGMAWPHLVTTVLQLAPDDAGLAGASATTVQLVTTALGSAIAGAVVNVAGFTDPDRTVDAARALFLVFLVTPVLAIVTAGVVRRGLLRGRSG